MKSIPLEGIREAAAPGATGTVLVLGDEALLELRPEDLKGRVRFPFCIALGVPGRVAVEDLSPWARSGLVDLVSPDALEERLLLAVRTPMRIPLPLEAWVPRRPKPKSLGSLAVLVLPTLRRTTVGEWASALDVNRRCLGRECARAFGIPPSGVVWAYIEAVTRRERAMGWTVQEITFSLGLAHPRSLWRLYRERGATVPARGGAGPHGQSQAVPNCPTLPKVSHRREPSAVVGSIAGRSEIDGGNPLR